VGRWAAVGMIAWVGGCATALPQRAEEQALYLDTRRVVELEETTDWVVDRLEIDETLSDVMESACLAGPETRLGAIRWLEARIVEEGGPAEEAWLRAGRDDGAISHLLTLERTRDVIREAHERAADDCPFWIEEEDGFAGIHSDADRVVILGESIGSGGLVFQGGDVAFGGAGGGRVLLGVGTSQRLTIAAGAELGGAADLPESEDGSRTLEARFYAGVPVLLRWRSTITLFDLEVAPTARFDLDDVRSPGFRVSLGGGLAALRTGGFMPQAVLFVGYEYVAPRTEGGLPAHAVRVGTKVGLDWDP